MESFSPALSPYCGAYMEQAGWNVLAANNNEAIVLVRGLKQKIRKMKSV